jgi:hypothetical protein
VPTIAGVNHAKNIPQSYKPAYCVLCQSVFSHDFAIHMSFILTSLLPRTLQEQLIINGRYYEIRISGYSIINFFISFAQTEENNPYKPGDRELFPLPHSHYSAKGLQ